MMGQVGQARSGGQAQGTLGNPSESSGCCDCPLPCAVQGRNTSVRDDLYQGLKIQEIDDPSKNVQGYLVRGKFITASFILTRHLVYSMYRTKGNSLRRHKSFMSFSLCGKNHDEWYRLEIGLYGRCKNKNRVRRGLATGIYILCRKKIEIMYIFFTVNLHGWYNSQLVYCAVVSCPSFFT